MWQEANKGMVGAGKANSTPLEEKAADGKTFIYAIKQQVKWYYISVIMFMQ